MKKNASTFIIVFALCSMFFGLFIGCKSQKNVARQQTHTSAVERVETKTDTSRVVTKTQADVEETLSVQETTERETIHFDDSGRVRTIVRESIQSQTGQRRVHRGSGSVVSVTGKSDSVATVETLREASQEKTDTKTDSRPVQGVEWFWIVAGILITAAVIFIVWRKFK